MLTISPPPSYKAAGANAIDEQGTPDTIEFLNIAADDVRSYPVPTHRTYPRTATAVMATTVSPFVRKSRAISATMLSIFNERLGLPVGALAERHQESETSGSEARYIRSPPMPGGMSEERSAIGAHTDFGSLVCLYSGGRRCLRLTLITPVLLMQSPWRSAGPRAGRRDMAIY